MHVCRLHTIIDCDMVLVMDNGLAAEWGRPAALLEDPNGTFASEPLLYLPIVPCPSAFQLPALVPVALQALVPAAFQA